MTEHNPYAAPSTSQPAQAAAAIQMDPKDHKKVNAVIKDARQFWLAIILCILCSGIGALIIPIWYSVRLMQWTSLSRKYPELLVAAGEPPDSIQAKFNSARWKLIVGLVTGSVVFALILLYLSIVYVSIIADLS